MLSTLLFTGLTSFGVAQSDRSTTLLNRLDQQNLVPAEEHRRSELAEVTTDVPGSVFDDSSDVSDVILGATSSLWKARGVEPQDGLIVYINGQVEDGDFPTEYNMLTATANAMKSCKFKRSYSTTDNDDLSEQLWVLESSGDYLGPDNIPDLYEAFFLRSLKYPSIRMSYFWDDADSDHPYLSLTCGKNYADRHQWIFQDITKADATWEEGSRYQIINRKYGMLDQCRMTSMNYENIVSGGMHYPNGEYICNTDLWGETKVAVDSDFSLDAYYEYFSIPGFIAPNLNTFEDEIIVAGNYRDIKLINPFGSDALWDPVSKTDNQVDAAVTHTFTYKTGIANSIEETSYQETHYDVSVTASVGGSAFGIDVSTEVGTSFGQSFSSSLASGTFLDQATTAQWTFTVPAFTCVELLQLKSITTDQITGVSFAFQSNQMLIRCCIGQEWQNPDFCESPYTYTVQSSEVVNTE